MAIPSSPLSTPASSPLKPIVIRGDSSEDMDDYRDEIQFVEEKQKQKTTAEQPAESGPGHVDEEEEQEEYEVEAIIDRRDGEAGTSKMYKIRWKGYGPEFDTWEPELNITAEDLIVAFEAQYAAKLLKKEKSRAMSSLLAKSQSASLRRSRTRYSSTASGATQDSGSGVSSMRGQSVIDSQSFFHRDPFYEAEQLIIPTATVLCEACWPSLRLGIESTANRPLKFRKLVVVHPATLIILRTPSTTQFSCNVKLLFKQTLNGIIKDIRERRLALFSNATIPDWNIFRTCAIDDVLRGGESYKLAWPWGLPNGTEDEFAHLVAAIWHVQNLRPAQRHCRLLVRKSKPGMLEMCEYYGISLVDLQGLHNETKN